NIVKGTKARAFFIPGNHDWSNQASNGVEIIKRQGNYINNNGNPNVKLFPLDGCPGPVEVKINNDIVLVMYDSQWFIRKPGTKPGIESDCGSKTEEQFFSELKDILDRNSDKLIILAGHHTLRSNGIHGGFFTIKQYFFPFTDMNPKLWIPVPFGFVYPIARGTYGTPEDLRYPRYRNMIKGIDSIAKKNKNVIFVGGHEHTLQLIKDSSYYYVVSGAGSKHTRVNSNKHLLYGSNSLGFATLSVSKNKNVQADFYTVYKDSVGHPFSKDIFNFSSIIKDPADSTTKIPDAVPTMSFEDSVTVAVDTQYVNVSTTHKFLLGTNYRKEWSTPVHLKVFRVDKENGGYTIIGIGGGKQTVSLSLRDKQGREWKLRTVDKNPEGVVAEQLRYVVPQKIIRDMISAEHPYAALAIPPLAEAAGIPHTDPVYYYVPDDPALGRYRSFFAKKVCLLEMDSPVSGEKETKSTAKIIDSVLDNNKNHIDQEAVLKARLLDMMIGDWDRHFDQWKFGTRDTGVGKLYYPVPRDRDEAFFNSDGLFIKSLSLAALPYLQGFKRHFYNIKWFNWEERYFDRFFMNNLDENTWKRIIKQFQADETDSVINNSIKKLPPNIYALDNKTIPAKLKSRRDLLSRAGLKYYRFLAKEVNVVGSNKSEYFRVSNSGNNLEVKVYKRKKNKDSTSVMFSRVFDARHTKYVNLYGLNGNDFFEVDSTADSKIKLRIIGGRGNDTFNIKGNVRNKIYDYTLDTNYIENSHKTSNEMSADLQVNNYDITGFNYNSYRLPLLSIGFNEEDKLSAGMGYSYKTYSFRKAPYSTYQRITSLFNFRTSAYQVKYNGEFNQRLGKYDLIANGQLYNTVLNNFYGLGNETKKEKDPSFYNVRYNSVYGEVFLRKRIHSLLEFNLGPAYYHYWNHYYDNKGKILGQPQFAGLDSLSIYSNKSYAGPKFSMIVHNVTGDLLPTRGVYWNTELSSLFGLNENSRQLTKLTSDFTLHSSLNDPPRLVIVWKFGYGHIFNKNYEYFQALTLGSNNYLRGFRKDRFAGRSLAYSSVEFRYKLAESASYIIPGSIGLLAFNDVGRVFTKPGISHKWHHSYGGGLYFSPYNFALFSATIAFSDEGSLFNFSLGTKFNITF
ncbi:MAG: metallophosphoesterase, partial [Ginsengibacter sp.]